MKHIQLPLITVLQGGPAPTAGSFEHGRDAALREIAAAYERALTMLDPRDLEERAWFGERLRDARCAAGLAPVAPVPHARE